MSFEVTILGSSSATPTIDRHPSAQVINIRDHCMLVDCGEATQNQLLHYKISHHKIRHIFISHLHGDHYLGLNGLLATINFQGRETPLNIYGPEPLERLIYDHFEVSGTRVRFPLLFHPTGNDRTRLILDEQEYTVESFPLNHRIPTTGFLFREKMELRHINAEACRQWNIPIASYGALKEGSDYVSPDGKVIENEILTFGPAKPRAYAYVSDTRMMPSLREVIHGVDLLYHESTFLHELVDRAEETLHTTAKEAGIMARESFVGKLLLGHYSARYRDLTPLLEEAQAEFENVALAIEGLKFTVD